MLVTFQTDAYESITMFGDVAQKLLKMMGHSATIPGAILAIDLPIALAKLNQALQGGQGHLPSHHNDDSEPVVSLKHRAIPLVALLEAAIQKKCDVLWS